MKRKSSNVKLSFNSECKLSKQPDEISLDKKFYFDNKHNLLFNIYFLSNLINN